MGLTCNTACLDCGEAAPEVGDCGYIGYPSASRERGPGGRPPNFGYLYEGFAAIRLVTHNLDSLDSFLRAHEGHRLHTFADGEPAFGDGGDDAEDMSEMDEDEDEDGGEDDDDWSEEDAAKYPIAHYRVRCKACGASFQADAPDNIKTFAPTPLTPDDIERMKTDAETHAGDDAKKKELIETRNVADQLIYTAEKALKDHGDKIPADVKNDVEDKIKVLRETKDKDDTAIIKTATGGLSTAMQKIGEAMSAVEPNQAKNDEASNQQDDSVRDAEVNDDENKETGDNPKSV